MHLYNRIATNALAIACSPYKNLKIVIDFILNLKIEIDFKNVHAARHCVSTCQYGPQLNTKIKSSFNYYPPEGRWTDIWSLRQSHLAFLANCVFASFFSIQTKNKNAFFQYNFYLRVVVRRLAWVCKSMLKTFNPRHWRLFSLHFFVVVFEFSGCVRRAISIS